MLGIERLVCLFTEISPGCLDISADVLHITSLQVDT